MLKFFKNKIILSISLALLLITGFGCKGLTASQQAAIRPVTLNYWTVYNDVKELQKLAADFQKLRPYITVNIKQIRYDEQDKMFTNALADDVAPDIMSVSVKNLRHYYNRLSEMPGTIKASSIITTGQYFKETTVQTTDVPMPTPRYVQTAYVQSVYKDAVIGNKILGLPISFDTLAIYYNKDLLDKAGIAEPPATWDDFMKDVKLTTKLNSAGQIVQSGVALGTGNNISNAFDILALFMAQSGVKMTDKGRVSFADGLNVNNLGSSSVVKALNFYTDFANANKEVYAWNEKQGNALEEFAQGKTAFYFGFAYDFPRVKALAPQLNVEIIKIPQLTADAPVNSADYWLETVPKKSKHQNEAWDFVRFIGLEENVKKYTTDVKRPTPYRSQIKDQKSDVVLGPFAEYLLTAENFYRGQDFDTAKNALANLLHGYLQPVGSGGENNTNKYIFDLLNNTVRVIQQTV